MAQLKCPKCSAPNETRQVKRQGTIVRFDADRGFGFLQSPESPADVFFHVRDFDRRDGQPAVGQAVDFEEIHVGTKGPRAMAVRRSGKPPPRAPARPPAVAPARPGSRAHRAPIAAAGAANGPTASVPLFATALAAELGLLLWCLVQGRLSPIMLVAGLLLNLVTFWAYWQDKHAAGQRAWRRSESSLHGMALAGGWPAAWWAQQLLRHKSRKPAFRSTYQATVVAHLALLALYAAWPLLIQRLGV